MKKEDCEKCRTKNGCAVELCPAGLDAMFVRDWSVNEIEAQTRKKSTQG